MRTGAVIPWMCAAVVVAGAGVLHVLDLRARIEVLETRPITEPARAERLEQRLGDVESAQRASLAAIAELSRTAERTREISDELRQLERGLGEAVCRIEEQRSFAARVATLEDEVGPRAIDERFARFGAGVEERWRELGSLAERAEQLATSARAGLDEVVHVIAHDTDGLWRDLLGPTVQVTGEETVGTGVLLSSEPVPGEEGYATYALTAWHVIRDLFDGDDAAVARVPLTIYGQGKQIRNEGALLVEYDADLDVALLRLDSRERFERAVRLAPRARLAEVRVFERVYAVGCPLGNDPIPTFGEIADTQHVVDGQAYWMVSAPTYIGNSGGGIFDAETHELLGLFTKIYTHGTVRPLVVPHMGLATPLASVYDWLERIGQAGLQPRAGDPQARTASASR